jgi:hypothetical protein
MTGTVRCQIFEAFKAWKILRIGISCAEHGENLQIFSNEEFPWLGEEKEPIFLRKYSSGKNISKFLSEHERDDYFKIMNQSKYRGVI